MESKKINQLATELTPVLSDLTIIGDPSTGISKKITLSQMASLFTGTVEEYPNLASFPLVGTADTIYIALDTNVLYRWDTGLTSYVELSPNIINSLVFNDANGFDGTIALVGSVATLTITTALTTGSVGFIGASGALLQDNANFFWDDTNNRLGIGTNAPTTAIDVFGSGIIGRLNGTSTNNAFLGFASAGSNKWSIGNVQSDHRFRIYNEATTSELVSVLQTGEFGIGIANPTTKLHIDGGASALIANLDANVSVAKSLSFRSDNSNRFNIEVSGTESGSNAGANFFIRRYSDAGSLIDTPLTITRSTGVATFANSVSGTQFNATLKYTFGTATDGTTGQIATDNTNTFIDYKGSLFFRSALASGIRITLTESGAATFVDDITITKGSTASFIANNTSASGKSYRLLSGDDGKFKIQNTGVLDLITITSLGNFGVGTTSPGYRFEVSNSGSGVTVGDFYVDTANNSVYVGRQSSVSGDNSKFYVRNRVNTLTALSVDPGGNGSVDIVGTLTATRGSNFATATGNVGIGTSSATNGKLEIQQAATTAALWAQTGGTTASYIIADFRTGTNLSALQINGAGYSTFSSYVEINSSGNALRINVPATYSAISVGGTGSIGVDYPGIGNGRFSISDNGNVGMPRTYGFTTSNAANLFIDSNGLLYRSTSSLRFKTSVEDLTINTTDLFSKMRPVWYRSLGDADRKDWSWYGFIAEELAIIEPRLVHWGKDKEGKDIADGVQYERITVLLTAEVQKLRKELDELKAK